MGIILEEMGGDVTMGFTQYWRELGKCFSINLFLLPYWNFRFQKLGYTLGFLAVTTPSLAVTTINLMEFRQQVEHGSRDYGSARLRQEGSILIDDNLSSISDLQVFSNIYYNDDRRPTVNPSFQGTQTSSSGFSLGLKKQFLSGPKMELGQYFSHTSIVGASSMSIPLPNYYDSYPKVSLTVPLWRNLWGVETKTQDKLQKMGSKAEVLGADLESSQLQLRIENTFYGLAAARENVQVQTEILERAQQILSWISSQYRRHLVDNSDLFQAQAAVTSRNMQVLEAHTQLADIEREFNILRGVTIDQVTEELIVSELPIADLKGMAQDLKKRKDLMLTTISTQMRELNQFQQGQLTKPKLDFVAEAQWNGRDQDFSRAQSEISTENQTLWFLGLQFSMPLDFSRSQDLRNGWAKMTQGSQLAQEAQENDFQRIWSDYVNLGNSLYQQIQFVRELEILQKKKADAERVRFNSGRSTTFQLLSFEQDYSTTKSQRIRLELNARQYLAQKILFEKYNETE